MGIWKAIPVFTNTLSCAGTSTLVGLYKSRPTDFGIACMLVYMQSVITLHREALWPPYSTILLCYSFAQLICPIYLYTKKYLETYAPSFSIHTLKFMNLSLLALKLCSVMLQEWTVSSSGSVSNI